MPIQRFSPPAVARYVASAATAAIMLVSGAWFSIYGPKTGLPAAGAPLQIWRTGSGYQVGIFDDTGRLSVSGAVISNGTTLTAGVTMDGADLRYVNISGDTMTGALNLSGALSVDGISYFNGATTGIDLSELDGLTADKTFNNGDNSMSFNFVNPSNQPTYDGAFEVQASGTFTGDLFHLHQHTGNPGASHLAHFETEDADVTPLRITSANTYGITMSGSMIAEGNIIAKGGTVSGSLLKMSNISPRCAIGQISGSGQTLATGSGKNAFNVPTFMSGYVMKFAELGVGRTGSGASVQARLIRNGTLIGKMFSTVISVDEDEYNSQTAATAAVINFAAATVQGGDVIEYDVPSAPSVAPKIVQLTQCFFAP